LSDLMYDLFGLKKNYIAKLRNKIEQVKISNPIMKLKPKIVNGQVYSY